MNWLTPLTALYAAALAVPLLFLLYFLKLKRHEQMVSSTFLWKRAAQDLQVNAPFQRLRKNILLLLQLLALLMVLLALGGPIMSLATGKGLRHVILIDRSASMNALDGAPDAETARSRLDEAKRQAHTYVDSLRDRSMFSLGDQSDQAMVIAFDDSALVTCSFTEDKHKLHQAIDAINPTDKRTAIVQAVSVAQAFAQSPGIEANNRSAEDLPRLVLFSDGRITDVNDLVVGDDELLYHRIGRDVRNVAITAMQARRSYENPNQLHIFATVSNYDAAPISADVQVSVNEDVVAIRALTLPVAQAQTTQTPFQPGQQSLDVIVSSDSGGIVEVRQLHDDLLPSDDAAWSVVLPPKKLSVHLVTEGNAVLESALAACPIAGLTVETPQQYQQQQAVAGADANAYDITVLDGFAPETLARGNYLVFGAAPNGVDVTLGGSLENQFVVDWRQQHAVLRYVDLSNLFVARAQRMSLPRDAQVLAEFSEGPALGLLRRQGSHFLLVGFDPLQTNWPFEPGFILFCYNAVSFLGAQSSLTQETQIPVGDPVALEGLVPGSVIKASGPQGLAQELLADKTGVARLPATPHVGVYRLQADSQADRLYAVNRLDEAESHIESVAQLALTGRSIEAQQGDVTESNVPVWPLLVVLALILVIGEWIVYHSKLRL